MAMACLFYFSISHTEMLYIDLFFILAVIHCIIFGYISHALMAIARAHFSYFSLSVCVNNQG